MNVSDAPDLCVVRPALLRRGLLLIGTLALGLFSGCTTTGLLLSAAGVATDSSVPWAIVKHVHAKLTEGDPTPCVFLNSVQRALSERCGEFVPGSLKAEDIQRPLLIVSALWRQYQKACALSRL